MRWLWLSIMLLSLSLACGHEDARHPARPPSATGIDALDAPALLALERAVAERSLAHQPVAHPDHVALGEGTIDAAGAHLGRVSIALAAMGRDEGLVALDADAAPRIAGPEVRIARAPGVIEWWRSLPSGLEQGVTIKARPLGQGELVLVMREGEGVRAELEGESITLVGGAGSLAEDAPLARYEQLSVIDRDGASVPARLAVLDGHIAIHIDDHAARYPLVVDPLVVSVEARLLASDRTDGDAFGAAVSLSGDGSRALVGAFQDDMFRGSAYVFARTGTTWTEEARLTASDGVANDRFGVSAALSADGRYAMVGASWDDGERGAVYVFRRGSGPVWSEEAKLTAGTRAVGARFGGSVALDGTGANAVVGAEGETAGQGAAYLLARNGATWSMMGPMVRTERRVTAFAPAAGDRYGASVAMAVNGTRALVGAPGTNGERGVADAWVVSTGVWGRVTTLEAPVRTAGDRFGWSVALSGDGIHALVGAMGGNAVHAFTWPSDFALFHEAALTVSGSAFLGASVSLSSDGGRALAGAYNGGAYTFLRAGSAWTFDATLPSEGDFFGRSVSLAGAGNRALVGASGAGAGTALIFGLGLDGVACTATSDCGSGFCVDGVCCNGACGGGASDDCQGCSAVLTGAANGTCAPLTATAVCRSSIGPCDVEERCSGTSLLCPADVVRPADTMCAASTGAACDVPDFCDGLSAACPARFAPDTMICAPAMAGGCDVDDLCTGSSIDCPARFLAAGTVCLASSGGPCDTDDVCTGASAECLPRFLEGVACRASTGACDPAEMCGSDPLCPADGLALAGTVCRASTDPLCDPAESCDGASAMCPADRMTCTTDAGLPDDGGPTSPDAGPPAPTAGCGCRASGAPLSAPWVLALGLALGLFRRARARAV